MHDYENQTQGSTNDELKNEQEEYITEHGCRECEFFSDEKWDIKKCIECDWNLKNRR